MIVPKILDWKPVSISTSPDWEIHALVSKRDFYQLLWALYSFFVATPNEVGLVVHDDGSLSDQHQMILKQLFPGSSLLMRADADSMMSDKLKSYPNCLNFRSGHVTNLKVLDFWLLANSKNIIYFDSDLIFFENPYEIFNQPHKNTFLKDVWTNYCTTINRLNEILGSPITTNVNIGFGCVSVKTFNLDFIESVLEYSEIRNAAYIADQTILALLASRDHLKLLDQRYQMLMNPPLKGRVVNHYTNVIRYKMYTEAILWLNANYLKPQ